MFWSHVGAYYITKKQNVTHFTYHTSHITHYNRGVLHYKETKCKTLYISHESHYTAGAS